MDVEPSAGGTIEVEQTAPSSYPTTLSFKNGTSVHLEAEPAPGYQFSNWSGGLSGTANPTTILINCNKKVTAHFSRIMYTLTMRVRGSGSATPTVGTHSYAEATVVTITATPDSGWQFDSWSGDVADPNSATTTVTIDSDKTFTANFSQVETSWWLVGGIIAGTIIIGVASWLAIRNRTAP